MTLRRLLAAVALLSLLLTACGQPTIGSADRPIKMHFVPSVETTKVANSGKAIGTILEKSTGLKFDITVGNSFAAVIEAMGAQKADVGWLNTFSYVLAHDKYGVDVKLVTVRRGAKAYTAEIVVRADRGMNCLKDLKGKKFAWVDPASTSGYLFPAAMVYEVAKEDPAKFFGQTIFAGKHDAAVIAVYKKQVDGAAVFGNAPEGDAKAQFCAPPPVPEAQRTDAPTIVKKALPDVLEVTKVVAVSDPIPNDTVSFRKGLPDEVTAKVTQGLLDLTKTEEGKQALKDLYDIDGLAPARDSDYDPVRNLVKAASAIGLKLPEIK